MPSDSNVRPDATLAEVEAIVEATGHTTMGVTHDGTPNGKLLGMLTSRDYRISHDGRDALVKDFMTPFEKLTVASLELPFQRLTSLSGTTS